MVDMTDRSRDHRAAAPARARTRGSGAGMTMSRRRPAAGGPLAQYLGYALRRAQLAVFEDFFQTYADLELRPAHFGLMVVISRSPGLKQAEASAVLGIQTPNFVALVDELERRGLAQRLRAENDRRSHALYLTKNGEALLKRILVRQDEHEARMTAKVGKVGREQLMALLDRLAAEAPGGAPARGPGHERG
jgi:DNA-binding MarR family transcriptional regulator